jgi:hypothetical protein
MQVFYNLLVDWKDRKEGFLVLLLSSWENATCVLDFQPKTETGDA